MKNLEKLEGRVPEGALSNSSLPPISIGVFILSEELRNGFNEFELTTIARKARITAFDAGSNAAIEALEHMSFDLIFLELDGSSDEILHKVSDISSKCPPGTKAIVASNVNDIELYRKLMNCGVSDYVTPPFTSAKITEAISKIYAENRSKQSKVISFLGAKGGVGSSVLAQNTAYYAANVLNEKTIILDFDLNFGTCSINFDITSKNSFSDLIQNSAQIDELLLERVIEKSSENLSIFALYNNPTHQIENLSEKFIKIIESAKKLADLVVVDLTNFASKDTAAVLRYVDEIILVAEPDLANLRNTITWKRYLDELGADAGSLHLILNKMRTHPRSALSDHDFKRMSSLEVCSLISFEPEVFLKSEELNIPAIAVDPKARSSTEIASFIRSILSKEPVVINKNYINRLINIFKG